jgi:hypothetical protein
LGLLLPGGPTGAAGFFSNTDLRFDTDVDAGYSIYVEVAVGVGLAGIC